MDKFFLFVFLVLVLNACYDGERRPRVYATLGKISDFKEKPVKEIYDHAILLRQDSSGFFAMSTLCTKELRRVGVRKESTGPVLVCDVCGSEYDGIGKVLKGPATEHLPFFKLEIDQGQIRGPKDTLYVRIGREVSSEWRLPYPEMIPTPEAKQ